MTAQSVVPWTCARCGAEVMPGVPGFDQGRVCSTCNRIVCRSCLATSRSLRPKKSICRDCAQISRPGTH